MKDLSLRDYFAATIAPHCLSQNTTINRSVVDGREKIDHVVNVNGAADMAYAIADALVARSYDGGSHHAAGLAGQALREGAKP